MHAKYTQVDVDEPLSEMQKIEPQSFIPDGTIVAEVAKTNLEN